MRKELNNIETIEKYLRNELSAADKKVFEEQLKTDTQLQKDVALQREVVKGIERIGAKQSIQKAQRSYQNRRRGFFLGLFVAVIITGVIGINYLGNNTVTKNIVSEDVTEFKVDSTEEQIEKNEPVIEVVDEQETNSEIVSLPTKKFQYFTINSSRDETITGKEGTKIIFKANSFDVPKNTVLKLRLKEYYKMSDIAFSNLTTETVEGKLLETGGMIYIDALVDGKKVNLKDGQFYELQFPYKKEKDGMKLFDGKTVNKSLKWVEAKEEKLAFVTDEYKTEEFVSEVFTIVEDMPEFKGGQNKLFEYLQKNVKYPAEAKRRYISGKVYVNFMIDEKGKVSNVRVLRGVHKLLDDEAKRVIESMPNWNPGKQRGKAVNVSYNLPINFKLDGFTASYTPEQIQYFSDSLKAARKKDIEKDIFGEDTLAYDKRSSEESIAKSKISSYVLSGSKLGWINCDRFIRRGKSTTLIVKLDNKKTDVKVVFHRFKGLMTGYNNGMLSSVSRVPLNEKVTIFAVKYENKKPYVCFKEIVTSSTLINLEFEELTKPKLKTITSQINQL